MKAKPGIIVKVIKVNTPLATCNAVLIECLTHKGVLKEQPFA